LEVVVVVAVVDAGVNGADNSGAVGLNGSCSVTINGMFNACALLMRNVETPTI
jgi:hypothetical protein